MHETKEIKALLKKEMLRFYGRKWAVLLAARTDYTDDYVRKYFRSDTRQIIIADRANEMIEEAKTNVQEAIKKIKS